MTALPGRLLEGIKQNYETLLYLGVVVLLTLALFKPQIQLRQNVHNYLLLADVTQSMNTEDEKIGTEVVSRMAFTSHLMTKIVETSPCGTHVSLGIFAAETAAMLFMPLEVCANYDEITDTIKRLDWRMAWQGNSRISYGIKSAERLFDSIGTPAQMLFFTDGDEMPVVTPVNKLSLDSVRIGRNVTLVGIGGQIPSPIPLFNAKNEWLGFWPADVIAVDVGAAGLAFSDAGKDDPDPHVAFTEFERYLSTQGAEYLQGLAGEVNGRYLNGEDNAEFYQAIQSLAPAGRLVTGYSIRWIYLSLAGLLVLLTLLPNALYKFRSHLRAGRRKT